MGGLSIKEGILLLFVGERSRLHVGSETGLTPTLHMCLASTEGDVQGSYISVTVPTLLGLLGGTP